MQANAAEPKPAARRRTKSLVAVLVVLGALAAGAIYGFTSWFKSEDAKERYIVQAAEVGDIEDTVTATGVLQPRDFVDVGTQVSGQLKIVHVQIGSAVKQGDLLAEIDPTVYRTRVDANQALLQNQTAQLADKQAQRVLAQQQLQRQLNLAKEEATTAEALQAAQAAARSLDAQIQAIRAQMQQTQSTLRGDEANLGYTKIHAPMSGTVVSQTAKQGQTLNANQQAPIILRIADLSVMTVQSQVSEADVSRLKLGMEAYFTTLGNGGKRWYGKLRQVLPTPAVVNNVVLYDALFDVPNNDQSLMTQMTAQVFFLVDEAKGVVVVPAAALENRMEKPRGARDAERKAKGKKSEAGQTVRVLKSDGSIETRAVQVGVRNRVSVQIVSGLQPGEELVVGLKQSEDIPRGTQDPTQRRTPPRI